MFDSAPRQRESCSVVLTLYFAALIFGLGTLLTQLMFSSSAHAEVPDPPALDAPDHAESSHEHLTHPHDSISGEVSTSPGDWASIVLSLRFYMFAAIAFGLVGAPVTLLGVSGTAATFAAALVTALLTGFGASLGFRVLGRQTLSSGVEPRELVGLVGRVLLPCDKGRRGKVRLNVRGQTIDYIAVTEEVALGTGAAVIVQEVHPDRLVVCAAPIELLSE
ncbi:MAG TPA: hypothetical protein VJU61_27920 [Polyangiaceae bacterium]|nr:hypothetical protein [Polyangiaceae bacterium]